MVVADREATTSPRDRSLVERLSLLPVVIALFVGSLYTVGAVLTTGQLRHANLVVRDTLPLVPLPQILARGMSVFLKPFAGVLGIAVVFVAVVALGEEIEAWLEGWTGASRRPPRRLLRLGALLIGVLALVLLSPTDVAIGIYGQNLQALLVMPTGGAGFFPVLRISPARRVGEGDRPARRSRTKFGSFTASLPNCVGRTPALSR